MTQKHVLVTFNHLPYGSIYYTEGLRAAVGVTSGIDEHTVDLLYLGDGVQYALQGVDRTDAKLYLTTLAGQGVSLKAERESLAERGLSASDLAEDVDVVSREEALALIKSADVIIDF